MSASLLLDPERSDRFEALKRTELPEDRLAPEARVILRRAGWYLHLTLEKALGDNRPEPRLYYLDGDCEILSTSEASRAGVA